MGYAVSFGVIYIYIYTRLKTVFQKKDDGGLDMSSDGKEGSTPVLWLSACDLN